MRAVSSRLGLSHQERALGYVLVLSSQPAAKPTGAHQWMEEYSGKQRLREIRSIGNEESCLPDSPLDESRRPTATVSSSSSGTRIASCEWVSAIDLYNQARVNGQEGGQETEIQIQSESTHGMKGSLEAKFPENNQRRD